jgi:filamentous hemagglutinin family protein
MANSRVNSYFATALLGDVWVRRPKVTRASVRAHFKGKCSTVAIMLAAAAPAPVFAQASPFSNTWFNQRPSAPATAVPTSQSPSAAAVTAAGLSVEQQQQIAKSTANFNRAADALRAQRQILTSAATAARGASFVRSDNRTVTDGISRGGLWYARGATDSYDVTTAAARSGASEANGLVWRGADLPTETANADLVPSGKNDGRLIINSSAKGQTLVTVRQRDERAILTWQNFDVGKNTTLYFNQTAPDGTPQRDWVALNRVLAGAPDANGRRVLSAPSLILGKIKSDGEVYVINQNGIIFGGSSLVNTNSLVASSLDVGLPFQRLDERNSYFLTNRSGRNNFSFQYLLETDAQRIREFGILKQSFSESVPQQGTIRIGSVNATLQTRLATIDEDAVEGDVIVEAGARQLGGTLDANDQPVGLSPNNLNLSRIVLAGPNVKNSGEILTADGQTALIGSRNFSIVSNDDRSGLPLDPVNRGANYLVGQQDWLATAQNGSDGALARPNPFIATNLNVSIFGNIQEGGDVNSTFPSSLGQSGLPAVRAGLVSPSGDEANYDFSRPGVFNNPNNGYLIRTDARGRRFVLQRTFITPDGSGAAYRGTVINDGVVSSPRGSVFVRAASVQQDGVIHATTSVNQAGLIDVQGINVFSATKIASPSPSLLTQSQNQTGTVRFSANAVTTILPDELVQADGTQKTIPSDSASLVNFKRSTVRISTVNDGGIRSADGIGVSQLTTNNLTQALGSIGFSSARGTTNEGRILFEAGSLLYAPSANATVKLGPPLQAIFPTVGDQEAGIILEGTTIDPNGKQTEGAILDVSGLTEVVRPMESNIVTVARVGQNELADSPLQRDEFIYRKRDIRIDRRVTGTREDGVLFRGTPLFDASGYIDARPQLVTELLTSGGTLDLGGAIAAGKGSLINIAGGYTRYEDGYLDTTTLLTEDGTRTVDIGRASPFDRYAGFAGQVTEDHSRWNTAIIYNDVGALGRQGRFEAGYIEGGNAGVLKFSPTYVTRTAEGQVASTFSPSLVFDGTLNAGSVTGPYQRRGSSYFDPLRGAPQGGTLDLSSVFIRNFTIATAADIEARRQLSPNAFVPALLAPGTVIDSDAFQNQYWSSEELNRSGIGTLRIGGVINSVPVNLISIGKDALAAPGDTPFNAEATKLILANGGTLALRANTINIAGSVTVHSGTVSAELLNPANTRVSTARSFTLASTGVIDVSGLFTNDADATRDNFQGFSFVDGGSVSIFPSSFDYQAPNSLLVSLEAGSRIELSSGGNVLRNRRLATTGPFGLGRGVGGSLNLRLSPLTNPQSVRLDANGVETADVGLRLDGVINAYGFQGGGAFRLGVPYLDIGLGETGGEGGKTNLAPNFFTDHGFGAFELTAVFSAKIADSTQIVLQQKQFLPSASLLTATTIGEAAIISQYSTNSLQRAPVNFSISGKGLTDGTSKIADVTAGNPAIIKNSFTADNALIIGRNASILGDPRAILSFSADGQLTFEGGNQTIVAKGGSITVQQSAGTALGLPYDGGISPITGLPISYNTGLIKSGARFDASGTFLRDLRQETYQSGTLLSGGSVSFLGTALNRGLGLPVLRGTPVDTGAFYALTGSVIDVSGGRAEIESLSGDSLKYGIIRQSVASAAGSISLAGTTLKSTLIARPGDSSAAGGTLNLRSDLITQTQNLDIDQLDLSLRPAAPFINSFATDLLSGSEIDTLNFVKGSQFGGTVSASVGRGLFVTDGTLSAATDHQVTDTLGIANVRLDAPYIRLGGLATNGNTGTPIGASADSGSQLTIGGSARHVDILSTMQLNGFAAARIASQGDIRFLPSLILNTVNDGRGQQVLQYRTELSSTGDLTLAAAQIYPASAVDATIRPFYAGGNRLNGAGSATIRIEQIGLRGETPLSVGGSLTLIAGTIEQKGTLRAPLGNITFGSNNASEFTTQSLVLNPGSLTSTSASGKLIPYGETRNLTDWVYPTLFDTILTAPPEKSVTINALSAQFDGASNGLAAAEIDLSGGGDVYATEFIPGLGGQRQILTTSLTSDRSAPIYAILPGAQPFVAPVELNGYSNLVPDLPGQTITLLDDVPGLPAGTYTLLPGAYATLPGAFRVQVQPTPTTEIKAGTVLPQLDGSYIVAGKSGTNGTEISSSLNLAYRISSKDSWSQYSDIRTSLGSVFFANLATKRGVAAPPLPTDAGRLSLTLSGIGRIFENDAVIRFDRAAGSRGGRVDISAEKIAVISDSLLPSLEASLADYLILSPSEIDTFGSTSLLLGGTRTSDIAGDKFTVGARDIRIATTDADPLENPELLFATSGTTFGVDEITGLEVPQLVPNAIRIDAGSAIRANGRYTGAATGSLIFGRNISIADAVANAQSVNFGDGSLLRFSNAGPVVISRFNVLSPSQSLVAVASDSAKPTTIQGGQALQIDTSGDVRFDDSTRLGGDTVDLFGKRLSLARGTSDQTVIGQATLGLLAGSRLLSLRGSESVSIGQPLTIKAAIGTNRIERLTINTPTFIANDFQGGSLRLDAQTVAITNEYAADQSAATPGNGTIEVDAETIQLTGKDRVVRGVDSFDFTATKAINFGEGKQSGTLKVAGDITLATPQITLAEGSTQAFSTTGSISSVGIGTAVPVGGAVSIGGRLALEAAGEIRIANTIDARAGVFEARGDAGITLESGAKINAKGYTQNFADKDVILSGGRVSLSSSAGDIRILAGSTVDVSADPRGNAGIFEAVISADADLELSGTLLATSGGTGTNGGTFRLNSNGAVVLDTLAQTLVASGFNREVSVRSGRGNLSLSATPITANTISFTADDRSKGSGFVSINTTLDASGGNGGTIELFGARGVTLSSSGALLAAAKGPVVDDRGGRGGIVRIGTSVLSPDTIVQNEGGVINLAAGSRIDVSDARDASGISLYSLSRGNGGAEVQIRAPIINNDVAVTIGSTISGARNVILEGFHRFTTGNSAFDGIVDPAGHFTAAGRYVQGTWRDPYGGIVQPGDVQNGLANPVNYTEASYFTPETIDPVTGARRSTANQAHVNFYQNTLRNFVVDAGVNADRFAGIGNFAFRPGIDLVNSDVALNGGDIAVLSNYNLGAGTSPSQLFFRTAEDNEPGVLTLRAAGDIRVSATISDGFFETSPFNSFRQYVLTDSQGDTRIGSRGARDLAPVNPLTGIAAPLPRGLLAFGIRNQNVENYSVEANIYYRNYDYFIKYLWTGFAQFNTQFQNTGANSVGVVGGILAYAPLGYAGPTDYDAYSVAYQTRYLANDVDEANADPRRTFQFTRFFRPALPTRPNDDAFYPAYAANYLAYLAKLNQLNAAGVLEGVAASAPLAPLGISSFAALSSYIRSPANQIANNPTAGNPFSDYTAPPLSSGDSFAMRFVAGSKTDSANPLSANGSRPLASFNLGDERTTAARPKGGRDVIRSGTGAIDIVAAKDIRVTNVNDVIYTAGNLVPVNAGFVDTTAIAKAVLEETKLPYEQLTTPGLFTQRGGDVRLLAGGSFIGAQDRADDFGLFRGPMSSADTSNQLALVFDSQLFSGNLGEFDQFGVDGGGASQRRVRRTVSHFLSQQGTSSANPITEGQFGGFSPRLAGGAIQSVSNSQSAEWVDIGKITGSVVATGGGNLSVIAGNAITDLNATIISTLQVAGGKSAGSAPELHRYGGGDLFVQAGGDIAGATLFVGRGDAKIESGGAIRQQIVIDVGVNAAGVVNTFFDGVPVTDSSIIGQYYLDNTGQVLTAGTPIPQFIRDQIQTEQILVGDNRLTIENGSVSVTARNGITLRGVNQIVANNIDFNGGLTPNGLTNSFNQLGESSSLSLLSTTGNVEIDNRLDGFQSTAVLAPFATSRFAAIATRGDVLVDGSLALAPSETGNLDLLAFGSLVLRSTASPREARVVTIGMDDRDPSALGSPLAPETALVLPPQSRFDLHRAEPTPLHFADSEPSRLIALNGDIISGRGLDTNPVSDATVTIIPVINLAESARINAGRDIVNMRFTGQNTRSDSITSIAAGRDIAYSIIPLLTTSNLPLPVPGGSTFTIGGAGQLSLVARRSIFLSPSLPAYRIAADTGITPFPTEARGLLSVGNELNPYLPEKSADLDVLFGVGPSFAQPGKINLTSFIDRYVNPANAAAVPTNYADDLTAFVNTRLAQSGRVGNLDYTAAIAEFAKFEEAAQRSFVETIFFSELQAIARPDDPKQFQNFTRGYTAIDTLFPAAQGYSNNLSDPAATRSTGDFDFTSSLLRTSQDSSITILGPGGNIVAGGLAEVASQRGNAASQGVLTLRGGNINIFTDGNLLVNTSRVFTLQGGDITIFATNGNIDAGRGRRTSSFLPPIVTSFLPTTAATVDFGGLVTGAGIGTLQTLPNASPADVFLLAPRGDIDAGDAGIRSSRDLFIVANRVLNGDNVQVSGKSTGVPTIAKTDVGGLTNAGNATKASGSSGGDPVRRRLDETPIIQVQLNSSGSDEQEDERRKKPKK